MKINMTNKTKTFVKWVVMIGGGIASAVASQMLTTNEVRDEVSKTIGKN